MIFCIAGTLMTLFMRTMAVVTDFIAEPIASWDLTVWSLSETAPRCDRSSMNLVMYVRVRTRSLAMIFTGPIWPRAAYFLMSAISFCSCFSRFARSRSSSRHALVISRLFFRSTSFRGTLRPNVWPMALVSRSPRLPCALPCVGPNVSPTQGSARRRRDRTFSAPQAEQFFFADF